MKKKFRVQATVTTSCYIDIEADSIEEANEIASETDGGDFISYDDEDSGEFNIVENLTTEI